METETPDYFNTDPDWMDYVASLEPVIRKIAQKLTSDEDMQEDCKQEARVALCTIRPENIVGNRDAYVRNVIRNSMLKYLASYNTGDWYSGRTVYRESEDGSTIRRYVPPRFASFDLLADEFGMEVDEHGAVSWVARDDGLSNDERANVKGPNLETVANDARANETELIDALYLEAMMAKLKSKDAQRVRDYLEGKGQFPRTAVHTIACVEGTKAKCSECGQIKEACEFSVWQWTTQQVCTPCEKGATAAGRMRKPRWHHGTNHGYTRHKCQCPECCAAHEVKNAADRARKRAKAAAEGRTIQPRQARHGTAYSYDKHHCRCPLCLSAKRIKDRRRRANRAAREGRIYRPRVQDTQVQSRAA